MKVFAIASFGSHCRNESDHTSDRDLMVVCERRRQFRIAEYFEQKGYSVSAYTPSQLFHMKYSGSLFLQHIKEEAFVTHDVDGYFRAFLHSCPMIAPSTKEVQMCKESIEGVFSWPDLEVLQACKVDVLYCLARDLFIKLLAANGKLAFGINDIAFQAGKKWGIPPVDFAGLQHAREVKNIYRSGDDSSSYDCSEIVRSLSKLLAHVGVERFEIGSKGVVSISESVSTERSSTYMLLRTLEAANTLCEACGLLHPHRNRILKLIRRPNAYGSSRKFRRDEIVILLKEVVSNFAANRVMRERGVLAGATEFRPMAEGGLGNF